MGLKNSVPQLSDSLISYGPCQYPTLGFVVDRYEKVRTFKAEDFWYIAVTVKRFSSEENKEVFVTFRWKRGHLFDHTTAKLLFDICKEEDEVEVTKVADKPTKKWKPKPLTTVELQKSGSRLFHLSPKRVLDVAEALYNRGLLSYPRTETDQFDKNFDFHSLIAKQTSDGAWGQYAQSLMDGRFNRPINGSNNDKAHPPIHPVAHANNLSGDEKTIYDYVTRRFLANCSDHALGKQTTVEIQIDQETFVASGLVVHERNYLDVFTYERWGGSLLPRFDRGERFKPTSCLLKKGSTMAPSLLTEADLVDIMNKNGIGTDATIAEHIAKVREREYVLGTQIGRITYLAPSTLGMSLVDAYNQLGFEKSLCKPMLRRELEYRVNLICEGQRTKEDTLEESIAEYKSVFIHTKRNFNTLSQIVSRYLSADPASLAIDGDGAQPPVPDIDFGDEDSYGDGHPGNGPPPPPRSGGTGARSNGQAASANRTSDRQSLPPAPVYNQGPPPPRPPAPGRSRSSPSDAQDGSNAPQCRCEEPAVKRTVMKEGANKGKQFWSCSKPQSDGCGFFDWVVEGAQSNYSSAQASGSRNTSWQSNATGTSIPSTNRRLQTQVDRSISPVQRQPLTSHSTGRAALNRPAATGSRQAAGGPSRAEIEEQDESIAVLDELMAGSQGSQIDDGQDDDRIQDYRAWFASLAENPDQGNSNIGASTSNGNGSHQASRSRQGGNYDGSQRCDCQLEAVLRTVSKEGVNQGRQFYCCPKESTQARCRFFVWVDEMQQGGGQGGGGFDDDDDANGYDDGILPRGWTASSIGASRNGSGNASSSTGTCYKCDQQGHWAKDCPGPVAGSSSRSAGRSRGSASRGRGAGKRSRGSASTSTGGGGVCFKCGEEGHWASACTNDGPPAFVAERGGGRGRARGSGVKRRASSSSRGGRKRR